MATLLITSLLASSVATGGFVGHNLPPRTGLMG